MAGTTSKKREIAVFIASPGDLGPERQQFREVIETLNTGFGDGADVTFEPLGWEALLSTVGQRSQSVINAGQIDCCDVFILVLNRRWGQEAPDSNYSSYTEEEFHRALTRYESSGTPTIFVFFKRVDPDSEGDAGPQLAKVMAFRQSLEDTHKVLYRYFDDDNSFANEVDTHLRAFARDELPDAGATTELTLLPLNAMEAIQAAKQAAKTAQEQAQESQEQVEIESTRAEALALQLAEDAAEAALDGKVEKARQRFAQAIVGTTNTEILSHAFQFYYRTRDLDSAVEIGERWQAATEPHSTDRAAAYGNLGIVHWTRGELDLAVDMYEKSLALNMELGDREGMANQYCNLGIAHWTRGELDPAVEMYAKSLAINTELDRKEGMATDYCNLGAVYEIQGNLGRAVEMYEKALAINTELGSKEGMAVLYGNLGGVYETRGELDQAVELFEMALALNTKLGRKEGMAIQCGNLGVVHRTRGELDQAVEMFEKSLALNNELNRKKGIATDYANLGAVHEARGELDQAVEMYKKSLVVEIELDRKEGMAIQYRNLGIVHERHSELGQARKVWAIALGLFEELGSPEAATVRQLLSELE